MLKRPHIFVASPFKGQFHNMRKAAELCQKIFEAGAIPYAPHLLFPWFMSENPEEREVALGMSTSLIDRGTFDALFYEEAPTSGMGKELNTAQPKIPIFTDIEDVRHFCKVWSLSHRR